jgi:2'-5' RNA ligase
MPRLFVAVWPPPDVLDALGELPRLPLAGARWTTRPQWHVTLRFLGSGVDPSVAAAALDTVVAEPCTAELGPTAHRLGRSVLMVPVGGLDALAAAVEEATAGLGRPPDDRPFRGHLTLARSRSGTAPRLDVAIRAQWPVTEITLVDSHTHPAGARYERLHTVALAPAHRSTNTTSSRSAVNRTR